jgi:hypothetical protein
VRCGDVITPIAVWPLLPEELSAPPFRSYPCSLGSHELRRLMGQGGFYVEQETVSDPAAVYTPAASPLIRLGKPRYFNLLS